jgi:ATPase family associated with various cellular activities (AAA)
MPGLFLITGIPGTGKTTFANALAKNFGFVHHDLEAPNTLNNLFADPTRFIGDTLQASGGVVATWGFVPDHQASVSIVLQFRAAGFKLIWFDGNRPAALRGFIKRGTVPEMLFYLQMYRIEASKIIDTVKPHVVDPFDVQGNFKATAVQLEEMRQQ